jgi:molybdenum cofactor cytidylyltransferase
MNRKNETSAPSPKDLIPIILAAGRGERIGGNKGLLLLGDERLLNRQLRILSQCELGRPVVVTGFEAESLERCVGAGQATLIFNPDWESGQTSSVQAGLRALPESCRGFYIMPVDFALALPKDWIATARAFRALPAVHRAIVRPVHGSAKGHPVLFEQSFKKDFLELNRDQPAHFVYRQHLDRVCEIEVSNEHIGFDLDTPEDLALAERVLLERSSDDQEAPKA